MKPTILIADDHKILREGLRSLIERSKLYRVIGESADGRSLLESVPALQPSVVIMDVTMPGMNGIEATARLKADSPEIKVIGLSMHSDRQYVVNMLRAGASGYLLKHCASDEVLEAIDTVLQGGLYLSPDIAGVDVSEFTGSEGYPEGLRGSPLSPKEREVLQQIAEGCQNKQIASNLFMSEKTVEKHRHNIMEKLDLWTVAELTKYAIREGITSVEK